MQSPEAPPFPWVYPYTIDEAAARDGREVSRPLVPIRIANQRVLGLVDSGADHVLLAPWLGMALGLSPGTPGEGILLGVGGERQWARTGDAELELIHPNGQHSVRWTAEVGVVDHWAPSFGILLGQRGFFDRFTPTFHRGVGAVAVEGLECFDRRFGMHLVDQGEAIWVPAAERRT